jgi:hypothetical protein
MVSVTRNNVKEQLRERKKDLLMVIKAAREANNNNPEDIDLEINNIKDELIKCFEACEYIIENVRNHTRKEIRYTEKFINRLDIISSEFTTL